MEKKCPYCGKEMDLGYINQDRFALKWVPEEKYKGPLLTSFFTKGIVLTGYKVADNLESLSVEALYCKECQKIIINTSDKHNQIK